MTKTPAGPAADVPSQFWRRLPEIHRQVVFFNNVHNFPLTKTGTLLIGQVWGIELIPQGK